MNKGIIEPTRNARQNTVNRRFSLRRGAKRLFSTGVSVLLSISAFLTVIPQTETIVYAFGDKTITGLCTGAIGNHTEGAGGWSYVYYGKYNNAAMKYRVLDKAATQFGGNTMLLDCDSTLTIMAHDSESPYEYGENGWTNSEINAWLNGDDFYGSTSVFTAQENAAIASSTKTDAAEGDGHSLAGTFGYAKLTGEHVFLLDAVEATRLSYGYADQATDHDTRRKNGASNLWWLRSPYSDFSAGYVDATGGIDRSSVRSDHNSVSPAFNLNLEAVIFSSLIPNKTNEYKLTVKDTNMTIAKTGGSDVTRAGNVVTVPYTITGGTPTQVSVLLTNTPYREGRAATTGYTYLKLNVENWSTSSGTGTFTLPEDYADQTCGTDYFAYIFAEDVNGTYETDYASAPAEITIPKPTLTITAKDKTYQYNGEMQGPGDTVYTDADDIAKMVTVEGLQAGDALTSITVDGRGKAVGDYDLTPKSAVINNRSSDINKYNVTYVDGTLHIISDEISYTVTFKVKNGKWNDGTKADKTVKLSGNAGDTLKLSAGQIPAVGAKPDTHYKEGRWDVTPDTKTVIASDMTYTYTYAPGKYTITFDPNAKDTSGKMDPQKIEKGKSEKLKANEYTRKGFTFAGWNTKKDGSGKKYADKASFKPEGDTTLYAQWKAKKYKVTVTADPAKCGTAKANVASGKSGKEVALKAVSKAGYKFKKWKVVSGGVKLADASKAKTTFKIKKANVKVKALFEKIYEEPQPEIESVDDDKLVLAWFTVDEAKGYDIFMSRCFHEGKEVAPKKIKTIKDGKTNKWTVTGLESEESYKAYIKAFTRDKNGKKKYISESPIMHVYTSGGNEFYTNAKSVKLDTSDGKIKKSKKSYKLSLDVKEAYKIKASVEKLDERKKLMPKSHVKTLRYISSDPGVASVSSKGKITAWKKGKCKIYVFAHNGINQTITLMVK